MKRKLKKVKKVDKPSVILPTEDSEELLQIKQIVHNSLTRIITGKTKKTYQQELHLIATTIQDYIDISYVDKVKHENELLEFLFKIINHLKNSKITRYKDNCNEYREEGFKQAINILEKISEGCENE